MAEARSPIAGTEHVDRPGEHTVGVAPADQALTVTVLLRRNPGGQAPSAQNLLSRKAQPINREAAEKALRANPEDLAAVKRFLFSEGLQVVAENAAARQIQAEGTTTQMNAAFGIQMKTAVVGSNLPYLTYDGAITVPSSLAGIVTAVLGLDNRPAATHH